MSNIKENIAKNIVLLRKERKWTQAELAEKLNYSDKAISKWERNESTPDVESLQQMADLFGVEIAYFFMDENKTKKETTSVKRIFYRRLLISLMLCTASIFVAVSIFTFNCIKDPSSASYMWISYVWALTLCPLIVTVFFIKMKNKLGTLIASSLFLWILLTAIYLTCVLNGDNFWLLYLIGIAVQGALFILRFLGTK